MRWPWQRVAADDGDAGGADGVGPSAASGAGASGSGASRAESGADAPRIAPAGWAFLPAIQRQISVAPPATLRSGWVDSLPTRVVPSRVAELTHVVDDAAPAGTVATASAALGAPVQRAAVADLTLRPPQTAAERARETAQRRVVQRQATQPEATAPDIATSPHTDPADARASTDVAISPDAAVPPDAAVSADPATSEPGAETPVRDAAVLEHPVGAESIASLAPPATPASAVASVPANEQGAAPLHLAHVQRTPDGEGPDASARLARDASGAPDAPDAPDVAGELHDDAPPPTPDAPTIAGSPPLVADPGRLGLAAPLPGALPSSTNAAPSAPGTPSAPSMPGGPTVPASPTAPFVQRTPSTDASTRRMGLGAPLRPGVRSEPRHPQPESGGQAVPEASTELPDVPATLQRSTAADAAHDTVSESSSPASEASAAAEAGAPIGGSATDMNLVSVAESPEGEAPGGSFPALPGEASAAERGSGILGRGAAEVSQDARIGPASPSEWAAQTDLALQRTTRAADEGAEPAGVAAAAPGAGGAGAGGSGMAGSAADESSAEGSSAEGSSAEGPSADGAPEGLHASPAQAAPPGPLPPLQTVPLIAQRALETSLESDSGPLTVPAHARAVPAVALEPSSGFEPTWTAAAPAGASGGGASNAGTVNAGASNAGAPGAGRPVGSGPAAVALQRAGVATSARSSGAGAGGGEPAATAATAAATAGAATAATAATAQASRTSGGAFGWVQRVLGRANPPAPAQAERAATGGSDGAGTSAADPGNAATAATAAGTENAAAAGDVAGTEYPLQRLGAPGPEATAGPGMALAAASIAATSPSAPLTVSRRAESASSPRLMPAFRASGGPARGATPTRVQRAVQTIEGPPAASVARMVLPVVPTVPVQRLDDAESQSGPGWGGTTADSGTPAGPVVQTAIGPAAPPPDEPGSTDVSAGSAGAAAAPGTAASGIDTSPAGIETLAARLYGPLARRLKAELLLDRERRGIRIDGI